MKCVFLEEKNGLCYADLTTVGDSWKVDEETKNKYCTKNDFTGCPRFQAKMDYLTKQTFATKTQ